MVRTRPNRSFIRFASMAAIAMAAVLASAAIPAYAATPVRGTVLFAADIPDKIATADDVQSVVTALTKGAASTDPSAASSKAIAGLKTVMAKVPDAMTVANDLYKTANDGNKKAIADQKVLADAPKPTDPAKIEQAAKDLAAADALVAKTKTDLDAKTKLIKDLDAAIRGADAAIKAFCGNVDKGIVPAKGVDGSTISATLSSDIEMAAGADAISIVTAGVPALAVYRSGDDWSVPAALLDTISKKYTALHADPIWPEAPKFESPAARVTLDADAAAVETNLPTAIKAISLHIPPRLVYIERIANVVGKNPGRGSRMALDRREVEKLVVANLLTLVPALDAYGKAKDAAKVEAKYLDAIRSSLVGFQVDIASIDLALLGDPSKNEQRVVSFYYFRDVQRIMKALRSNVTETTFGTPATSLAEMRQQIIGQDFDLQAKMATLSDGQQKLLALRQEEPAIKEKIQQAKQNLAAKQSDLDASNLKLIRLKSEQTAAGDAVTSAEGVRDAAKTAATEHAGDSTKTEEQRAAQAKLDQAALLVAQRKVDRAKETKRLADLVVAEETERNTTLTTDRDTAKTDYTSAQGELTANQGSQGTLNSDIRTAAIAVATSRSAGTGLTAKDNNLFAEIRDNAPFLHAPGDPASADPLLRVDFIGFKDKSRILLRGRPADLHVVEEILGAFDHPEPQAKLTLRTLEVNVINDQAGFGARNYNDSFTNIQRILRTAREQTTATETLLRDAINERVRVCEDNAGNRYSDLNISPEQKAILRRFSFYQHEAVRALGGAVSNEEDAAFAVRNIPDPARTTTLGEGLLVLMLASHTEQNLVLNLFDLNVKKYFEKRKFSIASAELDHLFAGSRRVLGIDGLEYQNPLGLSPQQMELVSAIQRRTVVNMVEEMRANGIAVTEMRRKQSTESQEEKKSREDLDRQLAPRYRFLVNQFGLDQGKLGRIFETSDSDDEGFVNFVSQFPRSEVNARIAAADKMLKTVIERIEDDVTELLVEPAMTAIRQELRKNRIEVGILTTTDVLATNRFPARVDAGATAQVALGETTDALAAAQQLAALALSTKTNDIYKIFKGLQSNPNEPSREIYGIGTGGLFNVTPVFDPSGQSLRFTFDYTTANHVREPNGSTNAQLPRVERHSINTEVELSTFELRNISEFVSNTKLGLAQHQWGGIPILNDIPVLKELPIIGWFVRKEGRAAVSQHSLVFAQSTVYPTIDDMLTLLTPVSSRVVYGGK